LIKVLAALKESIIGGVRSTVYTRGTAPVYTCRRVSGGVIVDIRAKGKRLHLPDEYNIPEHCNGQPSYRQPQQRLSRGVDQPDHCTALAAQGLAGESPQREAWQLGRLPSDNIRPGLEPRN